MTILPLPIFFGFGFFQVLAIFLSDEAVDRSIPGYPRFYLAERFCFMFHDIHKKGGRHSSNLGYKIQKFVAGNILAHTHFWRESTQIENSSRKKAQQL